jgi:hypothetical protein
MDWRNFVAENKTIRCQEIAQPNKNWKGLTE